MIIYFIGQEGPVHWELNRNAHILSFKGEGALPNFHPFRGKLPAWMPLKEQVHEVRIGEGITRIGHYAFYPCLPVFPGVYREICFPGKQPHAVH